MSGTLVILAAGIGRRYGGLKQLDPVGPNGETILEYSIHDAIRAGFTQVIFVTRRDIEAEFRRVVGRRVEAHVPVRYAHQELGTAFGEHSPPPERTKPWGTGQAVLAAKDIVRGSFAVANADDFYGPSSWTLLAEHLSIATHAELTEHAIIGFRLESTLSEVGSVSRGVCRCTDDGRLVEIMEHTRIERVGAAIQSVGDDDRARPLSPATTVSMNMWGFGESILDQLKELFIRFVRQHHSSRNAEFGLPVAVNELVGTGRARVRVIPTTESWCGITYAEDKPHVSERIRTLVDRGEYPSSLWT